MVVGQLFATVPQDETTASVESEGVQRRRCRQGWTTRSAMSRSRRCSEYTSQEKEFQRRIWTSSRPSTQLRRWESYFHPLTHTLFLPGLCHRCYLPQPGWHTCHPLPASPGSCRSCWNWVQASSDDWHEKPTGGRQQPVFHCLPGRSLSKSVHLTCAGSSGKLHPLALLLPVFHAGTISSWRPPAAEVSAPKQQH